MPVRKEINLPSLYKNGLLYAWFGAMHTRVDLLLSGNEEASLKSIVSQIAAEIERLEKIGNYFDPESELSYVNKSAYLQTVNLSDDLIQMLTHCIKYNKLTQGLFDISIHSDNHHPRTLEAVLLDENSKSIRFLKEGIRLDLSGFLKGFALDKIREILSIHSISDALINMGNSSILAIGNHPNGKGWKIQLADPEEKDKSYTLFDECYTTSGNEKTGRRHILNPRTGLYLQEKKTTSVISRSGSLGEALSTAFCLIDREEQEEILVHIPECELASLSLRA